MKSILCVFVSAALLLVTTFPASAQPANPNTVQEENSEIANVEETVANIQLPPRFYNGIGVTLSEYEPYNPRLICDGPPWEPPQIPTSEPSGRIWIHGVRKDSPAEKAGLQCGDVAIRLNSNRIETFSDLSGPVKFAPAGTSFELTILRLTSGFPDGKSHMVEKTVTVLSSKLDRVEYPDADQNRLEGSSGMGSDDKWEQLSYTFWFEEVSPGHFRSVCAFENTSTFPVKTFIKVPPLTEGSNAIEFSLSTGEKREFVIEWTVEDSGIPVHADFEVRHTHYWTPEQIAGLLEQYPDSRNHILEESGNHYVWGGSGMSCWLPERRALYFRARQEADLPFFENLR